MDRPFRVPLGGFRIRGLWFGVTPCLGIVLCSAMAGPLVFDVIHTVGSGNPVPALLLGGHALVGLAIYTFYGHRHSRPGRALGPVSLDPPPVPDPCRCFQTPTPTRPWGLRTRTSLP